MTHSPLKCRITEADIVTFQTDGAICLRDAFDQKWIEILMKGIEQNRLNPSAMTKRKGHTPLFFHDYNNWRSTPEYEEFIFQSGAGEIAATLLQSLVSVNDTMAVFSRQPLSRLTFLKVVCLQTSLSDFKRIQVFTSKIKRGESTCQYINMNNMAGE